MECLKPEEMHLFGLWRIGQAEQRTQTNHHEESPRNSNHKQRNLILPWKHHCSVNLQQAFRIFRLFIFSSLTRPPRDTVTPGCNGWPGFPLSLSRQGGEGGEFPKCWKHWQPQDLQISWADPPLPSASFTRHKAPGTRMTTRRYVCAWVCVYLRMHVRVCAHMRVCLLVYVRVCTYACVPASLCVCAHMCVCAYRPVMEGEG